MKRIFLTLVLLLCATLGAQAAYLRNVPVALLQPNGDTLHCFATGDEYYQRLHDAQGYTILQDPATGYYCYALRQADGSLAPALVAAPSSPSTPAALQALGITPNLMPAQALLEQRRQAWDVPQALRPAEAKGRAKNLGTMHNLVIFVRFAGDQEITQSFSTINSMFNDSSATSTSMFQYFREASYGQLRLLSHFYPEPQGNSVVSYQDTFPRAYYTPYSASNPTGYQNSTERRAREFAMIERCANWINQHAPVDPSLNLDHDNDGLIDNVVFVVKGTYVGWSEMLWPHKWSLYDRTVYINGKRLYTYNLQLEGSGSHYFSSSTLCHEMFHTLGAPDLYRYSENDAVSPAGSWDLMCSNTTPPQHMSMFMKLTYGGWIDEIVEATLPGTYTLSSVADQNPQHPRAYAIPTQDPNQYWILEYRNQTQHFETGLPGSGLLIWRADTRFNGNASYDGTENFDGYYLMRPGASNDRANGTPNRAHFGQHVSRPTFNASSNPHPWVNPGVVDTSIAIIDIVRSSDRSTISFTYVDLRPCLQPSQLRCTRASQHTADISWQGRSVAYRVEWRLQGEGNPVHQLRASQSSASLDDLQPNTSYEFRVRGLCSETDSSDFSPWTPFFTPACEEPSAATLGNPDALSSFLPVNTGYNYSLSQQIVKASEIGSALNLNAIEFYYSGDTPLSTKTRCALYLGHTDLAGFSSNSATAQQQALPLAGLTPVYHGHMPGQPGWNRITFQRPFLYNGRDNLILVVVDSSNAKGQSGSQYAVQNTTARMAFSLFSNSAMPLADNPAADSTSSRRTEAHRTYMTLIGCDTTLANVSIPVSSDEAPLAVRIQGLQLTLLGADGQAVVVTDLLGRRLYRADRHDGRSIPLPHPGLYLVRAADRPAVKVMVR